MDHLNLLRKIAWTFHKKTRENWDDLFQEAALAYLQALDTYTPEKGAISTYVWRSIWNHLEDYRCQLQRKYYGNGLESYEDVFRYETEMPEFYWEGLTEDACEIAKLVLKSYKKFASMPSYQAYHRVRKMMAARGWDETKIEKGIEDLEAAFS